jgi:hypothetical protein
MCLCVQYMSDIFAILANLIQPFHIDHFRLHVTDDWTLILPPNKNSNRSCVVGLGCIESSFLCQTTPCVRDFNDENLAPVLLFLQYLTQLEVGKLYFIWF